jgi:hypothetical protein
MLIQLSKSMRLRVASVLALLYTLCVLAPAAAFAFGDGSGVAHCLTDDNHGLRPVHVHQHNIDRHDGGKAHVHADGTNHEHSKAPDGKSTDTKCCGLVCLSALPTSILEVQAPVLPAMIAVCANQENVASKAPERLYRPPIPLSL